MPLSSANPFTFLRNVALLSIAPASGMPCRVAKVTAGGRGGAGGPAGGRPACWADGDDRAGRRRPTRAPGRPGNNSGMNPGYLDQEPSRAEVDGLPGATLLEFGTPWCGWCRGAQAHIGQALSAHPGVRHLKVEDGSGRPLGRSFRVKLWPTLVFLRDGREVARLVRPNAADQVSEALGRIAAPAGAPGAPEDVPGR